MPQFRWTLKPPAPGAPELAAALGVLPEVAAILAQRGLDEPVSAGRFLNPRLAELRPPQLMADMEIAVARIEQAALRGERVTLFADYDVDGVTSAAIMTELLQAAGIPVSCVIPNRLSEGYGLSEAALARVAASRPSLLITLDAGISDGPRIKRAAEAGIETIIVDHHEVPPDPPPALAIINPRRAECQFPFKSLAAVGLAFYLACAVRTRLLGPYPTLPSPHEWLELVALGTVADLAPLREENRILVKAGLERLTHTARPGLVALKEVSGCRGQVSAGDIGYRLGPRLNAAGRMGDATRALKLLITRYESEARQLASELEEENSRRQAVEAGIEEECLRLLEGVSLGRSVVIEGASWHPGVIGIVASRLVERLGRPAIVLAEENGCWRGSARGIRGLHLFEALAECGHLLERFGGHRQAGGLLVSDENLAAFREAFEAQCVRRLTEADLMPLLELDLALPLERVSLRLAEELTCLEPCGVGNPRPVFAASGVRPVSWERLKEQHLRAGLSGGNGRIEAIGFRLWAEQPPGAVDIAFQPEINEWRGARSLRLNLKAIRPAAGGFLEP
jgi:single-stranded-DNA-specific exonuclease